MTLKGKHILLGVTGGIAAYKAANLVRRLREVGAEVRVAMTAAAQNFVTPLTFQALSGYPVAFDGQAALSEFAMDHIELARWADALLIAPASADFMAKVACGLAGDILSTLVLATRAPLIIVPAMNRVMWENEATQRNKNTLIQNGVYLLEPGEGKQACGDYGAGCLQESAEILMHLEKILSYQDDLKGLNILISAGPTQEAIDPVRFLSNHSSGKMGHAIADAAARRGAQVTLVSGPVSLSCPFGVKRISVVTAQEMYDAVMSSVKNHAVFISTAAVADYRPQYVATQKIKKLSDTIDISLIKNPDILKSVAQLDSPPFTVGFAAETENILENAHKKFKEKKLKMLAVNDVKDIDIGFNSDKNALTVLWEGGSQTLPTSSKMNLANHLLSLISDLLNHRRINFTNENL